MNRIGIISDTHGLLRPEAVDALCGSDLIVHAGDVGSPAILPALEEIAPVVAVRGNIDVEPWAAALPLTVTIEVGGASILILHDLAQLSHPARACDILITGHSHKPERRQTAAFLHINPGSAGPRRFKLPVTVARLQLSFRPWSVEIVQLDRGGN